jgi:hypothetical protein
VTDWDSDKTQINFCIEQTGPTDHYFDHTGTDGHDLDRPIGLEAARHADERIIEAVLTATTLHAACESARAAGAEGPASTACVAAANSICAGTGVTAKPTAAADIRTASRRNDFGS